MSQLGDRSPQSWGPTYFAFDSTGKNMAKIKAKWVGTQLWRPLSPSSDKIFTQKLLQNDRMGLLCKPYNFGGLTPSHEELTQETFLDPPPREWFQITAFIIIQYTKSGQDWLLNDRQRYKAWNEDGTAKA